MREAPRYHVISMRVSDEERETLDAFALRSSRNISQLMREAMLVFAHDRLLHTDTILSGPGLHTTEMTRGAEVRAYDYQS